MTTIGSTTATNTATATAATGASARLNGNFETFLNLLTAQLKNQDPTSPMDVNQFTQQLVQYSQVEQQISTNEKLTQLLSNFQGNQSNAALGFLGRRVSFNAAEAQPTATGATWNFDAPSNGQYTLRVRDADGALVHEQSQFLVSGMPSTFAWDGARRDRQPIGSRPYRLELLRNVGSSQTPVDVTGSGQVTSVDMTGSEATLSVGTMRFGTSRVRSVSL